MGTRGSHRRNPDSAPRYFHSPRAALCRLHIAFADVALRLIERNALGEGQLGEQENSGAKNCDAGHRTNSSDNRRRTKQENEKSWTTSPTMGNLKRRASPAA